jgi:hypothetical protein
LTPDEIEAFRRDGVVCIRGVMPRRWIDRMGEAVDRVIATPTEIGAMISEPEVGFTNDIFLWLKDAAYRAFVFESHGTR